MSKTVDEIKDLLENIVDPEIPVLTIKDIGILRDVNINSDGILEVVITPTYVGCPAMGVIEEDIELLFKKHSIENYKIDLVLSPAWTTDWISDEAKLKLEEYGIAPPIGHSQDKSFITSSPKTIRCPQCKSESTKMISQFGSTACKSLYKCEDCLEPFDYFKCF